jgi:hypothetical protein
MALDPSIRKIPIIGGTIFKVGQVYDLVNTPCDPDPWLWVYAFWHEVPYIFAMLLLPDPVDYVQERFGKPHHRKRRHKGKAAFWKPADINPGKGLGWAAFRMTEWVDKIGWQLLIADTAVNFAFNWTSLVYQWSGCEVPGTPYISQRRTHGLESFPGGWQQPITYLQSNHILRPGGGDTIVVPDGYTASFTTALTVSPRPFPYDNTDVRTRLRNATTGRVIHFDKPKRNDAGEYVSSNVWKDPRRAIGDETWVFEMDVGPGNLAWTTNAIFSAYGSNKVEGLIPWLGDIELK